MIKAGFYECDITPPLGTECPGGFTKRLIKVICDALKVRAVVFDDGKRKVALVGIDTIGAGPLFRKKVEELLPDFEVIMSASHTHSGGNLRDPFPNQEKLPPDVLENMRTELTFHDADYYNSCLKQVVTAVTLAAERVEEVDFSFGRGRVDNLIFNRRISMKDGTALTHPGKGNPENADYAGPVDNELGAMGLWKKGTDKLLGCVINFSCHACINLEGASSDFPGVAVNAVKGVFGPETGVVYINGASGDVTQIDNLSLKKDTGKRIAYKLGRTVGGEAVKVLANADRGECSTLRVLKGDLTLERKKLDAEKVAEAYKHAGKDDPEFARCRWLITRDFTYKANPSPVETLRVIQIGPLLIGSSSGEMFAQYALDFKAASRFPFTWYSQLASDQLGYVPSPDCFKEGRGGYETVNARFAPDTGTKVINLLLSLAKDLTPDPAPQPILVERVTEAWSANGDRTAKKK
ncbi:MAG: hypothetical protein J6A21_06585 [Lentisphaeria bacterium]|nr:hypothetical protein [Lentisphaeria bacterium]